MNSDEQFNSFNKPGIFTDPIEQIGTGRRETFHQLESRPDLFIRRREINHADTERASWADEQFAKLRSSGVRVPDFRTVIGEGPEGAAEYLVVDKVQGETLELLLKDNAPIPVEVVNRTFSGLTQYLKDGQQSGEPVVWDFAMRQFMYGHTAKDTEDDLYFVDVDPVFRKVNGEILERVAEIMRSLHEVTPIEDDTWKTMRELIITNDTGRISEDGMAETKAWLDENMPPKR